MNIIKWILTISFNVILINYSRGQGNQNALVYNATEIGNQVHVGCKSIEFKLGYYYSAQSSSINSYIYAKTNSYKGFEQY